MSPHPHTSSPRVRRVIAATVTALMALSAAVGIAAPAAAATLDTAATVTKAVIEPQPEYLVGQTVAYRLTTQCSSLTVPCGIGTLVDQLDENLEFQNLVYPSSAGVDGTLPTLSHTVSDDGLLTVTIGSSAAPYLDGQSLEFVLYAKVVSYPVATDGVIPNQAEITITNGNKNVSDRVDITVVQPENNWTLRKTQQNPANPIPLNTDVRYLLEFVRPAVNNAPVGGVDIVGGRLVDTLPPGSVFVPALTTPAGFTYNEAAHTVSWDLPLISATTGLTCQWGTCWSNAFRASVGVHYPSPPFVAGGSATNNALASVDFLGGTTGELPAAATTTFLGAGTETFEATSVKLGPASAFPGESVQWSFSMRNTGKSHLSNPQIIEELPAGLESVQLVRQNAGLQPMNTPGISVYAEFSQDGGTTWSGRTEIVSTLLAVPAGTTHLKLTAARLPYGTTMSMDLRATVPEGTPVGTQLTNCIVSSADGDITWGVQRACSTTTVSGKTATMVIRKGHLFADARAASVRPGDIFDWAVAVRLEGGAPVDTIVISDLLPPEFEYLETSCFSRVPYSGNINAPTPFAEACAPLPGSTNGNRTSLPIPEVIVSPEPGGTRVTFPEVPLNTPGSTQPLGDWYIVHLSVRVKPGTSIDTYTNVAYTTTNDADIVQCRNENVTGVAPAVDVADIDGDGNTTEMICGASDPVPVAEAAYVDLTKWDKGTEPNVREATALPDATCPDWDGFTRFPCVAQTLPGGEFSYRLRMVNQGNVPLTDYVVYDILPIVGDTGVGETLGDASRGTEWSPVLTGPVVLEGALSNAADSGYLVEYNLTSDPCRPELAEGTADRDWQAGLCDDTWVTTVADWSTVKSLRITAFQNGGLWAPGTEMVFSVPMTAPLDAPQSVLDADGVDLSVAWNSVAQRVFRTNADGTTLRLESYEPRKVGIIVPLTIPPMVSIGDYVWFDENRDGQQDAAEAPAPGVVVRLLDENGVEVANTITDAEGYYWFQNLTPLADYTIVFEKPAGYEWTVRDTGADTSDSDVDPVTHSIAVTAPAYVEGVSQNLGAKLISDDPTFDAGLVAPIVIPDAYAVGDYVWIDADRDGVQDASEKPVPNVTVTLFTADGAAAVHSDGSPVEPTVTDAVGHYVFDDLAAGAYRIVFTKLPVGYVTTRAQTPLDQAAAADSNVPAFRVGTASTGVFTLGLGEAGMSEVLDSDGVSIAMLINRTIDAGITLAPPLPETGGGGGGTPSTPPTLAHTGQTGNGVIGGAALLLLIGGLVMMVVRRRQEP